MRRLARVWVAVVFLAGLAVNASAQPVFRGSEIFPPEEFAARRAKLMAQIGDGVAIILGTPGPPGEMPFRQNSQFFYLTGVAEPRARAIVDGRAKSTTVFLQPANERRDASMYGPALAPGAETAKSLGVEAAVPDAEFTAAVAALASEHRIIYTPFAAEVLGSQSQGDPTRFWAANQADPWDGRPSREAAFLAKLKAAAPGADIRNLDPVLNALRAVKSAREIEVIREATRIAGLAIVEAMKDAKPGLREYDLQADAEFVFKKLGALGPAYFALVATGKNTYYTHYNRNTAVLEDGDLVQFDYAPDYKYYQSDVTRVFPANGKFTPRQREFYDIYLQLYRALMTSIKVHQKPIDTIRAAVQKMDAIMASYRFTDERIKTAAVTFVDGFRNRQQANGLGHNVGLEVHDPGGLQAETFEPGRIFTIEPMMRIEEEHIAIRLEDMILITDTGYENLSQFVPIEIADIERVMAQRGLSDAMPGGGTSAQKDKEMNLHASGTFDVTIKPQTLADAAADKTLGRMSLDKRFQGDLQGTSSGEMLTAQTAVEGSAGYVAIERVSATLQGRKGTFVLQHVGTMARGAQQLAISVVPDSGTGDLAGLRGTMTIRIEGGKHYYDFAYSLD